MFFSPKPTPCQVPESDWGHICWSNQELIFLAGISATKISSHVNLNLNMKGPNLWTSLTSFVYRDLIYETCLNLDWGSILTDIQQRAFHHCYPLFHPHALISICIFYEPLHSSILNSWQSTETDQELNIHQTYSWVLLAWLVQLCISNHPTSQEWFWEACLKAI